MSKLKHAAPSSSKRFLIDTTARNPVAQGFSQSNIFSNMGDLAAESRGITASHFKLLPKDLTVYSVLLHTWAMNQVKASKAPKDPEMVRIGRTLFTLRERYGYTQKELADAVEISRAYISLIESGAKPLQDRLLAKVAAALEVTPLAIKRYDHEDMMVAA